jgi:soluble lytic murein transglycosylase-like protein
MVGGLAALAIGPLLAIGHTSHVIPTAAAVPATGLVAAVAAEKVDYLPTRYVADEMRAPDPTPTPAPPPPPTPRPTAAPTVRAAVVQAPAAPIPPAGSIEAIILAAATKYGVSYDWMLKIARCESSLNPRAYNPAGPYIGLFQFLPSTFRAHGGTDIYDPVQQANIAADMLAHGQARAWGCA